MCRDNSNVPSANSDGGLDPRIPRGVRNVEVKNGKAIKPFHLIVAAGALVSGLIIGTFLRPHLTPAIQWRLLILLSAIGFAVLALDAWLRKRVWKE